MTAEEIRADALAFSLAITNPVVDADRTSPACQVCAAYEIAAQLAELNATAADLAKTAAEFLRLTKEAMNA